MPKIDKAIEALKKGILVKKLDGSFFAHQAEDLSLVCHNGVYGLTVRRFGGLLGVSDYAKTWVLLGESFDPIDDAKEVRVGLAPLLADEREGYWYAAEDIALFAERCGPKALLAATELLSPIDVDLLINALWRSDYDIFQPWFKALLKRGDSPRVAKDLLELYADSFGKVEDLEA